MFLQSSKFQMCSHIVHMWIVCSFPINNKMLQKRLPRLQFPAPCTSEISVTWLLIFCTCLQHFKRNVHDYNILKGGYVPCFVCEVRLNGFVACLLLMLVFMVLTYVLFLVFAFFFSCLWQISFRIFRIFFLTFLSYPSIFNKTSVCTYVRLEPAFLTKYIKRLKIILQMGGNVCI